MGDKSWENGEKFAQCGTKEGCEDLAGKEKRIGRGEITLEEEGGELFNKFNNVPISRRSPLFRLIGPFIHLLFRLTSA
jgi:hypothetical protein